MDYKPGYIEFSINYEGKDYVGYYKYDKKKGIISVNYGTRSSETWISSFSMIDFLTKDLLIKLIKEERCSE